MSNKIYWLSRHDLSPAQTNAVKALHGDDAVVEKIPAILQGQGGLTDFVRERADGFTYAVGGAVHYVDAALSGAKFGIFENHPTKRGDGQFGLAAVYHVGAGKLAKVWVNPDPASDVGEALIPVARG